MMMTMKGEGKSPSRRCSRCLSPVQINRDSLPSFSSFLSWISSNQSLPPPFMHAPLLI
ncbi:uncharacterized protein DS421_2g51620 [Arachis hypogaea]|nr:uncharacterized protein DS421_2g51620 [Arachis hypogaea]